jgi:hypothetical protein
MSEKPYAIVQGALGESLWPRGIVIVDSYEDEAQARRAANLRAYTERKPYRVILMIECVAFDPRDLQVLEGEGLNPMSDEERAENRAGILEAKKEGKL